jgi:VMA21-like domain
MFTIPILTFYVAQYIFREKKGSENYAGAAAIVAVNLIIAGYCVKAFREDRDENKNDNEEAGPRVGFYKQRTD